MALLFSTQLASADECNGLLKEINFLKLELESLHQSNLEMDKLLSADLGFESKPLSSFSFAIDDQALVNAELEVIRSREKLLSEPVTLPKKWSSCGNQKELWLELTKKHRQLLASLNASKVDILTLPSDMRITLQRELESWQELSMVYQKTIDATFENEPTTSQQTLALKKRFNLIYLEPILAYKSQLEGWVAMLLNQHTHPSAVNLAWLLLMEYHYEKAATFDNDLNLNTTDLSEALNEAKRSLVLSASEWRNAVMLDAGWLGFIKETSKPSYFIEGLIYEFKTAPKNFVDNISNPFIREYLSSEKESKGAQVLTSWILQLAVLLVLVFGIIKAAAHSASWLSGVQQGLFKKLESATSHSIFSGIFWVLKPNATWLFILIAGNVIGYVLPAEWRIIQLIAPLATIYAGFRAFRIIIEWGLSRTYTRSGMFLSNHTAEQLTSDSQRMTWALVYASFFWGLVYVTGGAFFIYLLSLVYVFLLWCGAWWVLLRHDVAVNKLIHMVLSIKPTQEQAANKRLLVWMNRIAWPLVFVFVHILDVISNVNQKLMVFDVYRSFSVKLLRVRLESKSEEVTEEDEGEPDQSYSDWMLRDVPESLLFEVGDLSSLLDPLNNWFNDKTDENVMVILGESGSGKSTLVRRLPTLWAESPIRVLDVPAKVTDTQVFFDSIAEVLGVEPFNDVGGLVRQDEKIERQVIVIDSAHNLFLAEVGQFGAYKSLLECMNAHLENVFWVVVMHAPSWTYLNYVFVREQRVSNIYKMPRWSPMDIRKLILSRHHGGRRRLKYNEMLLSAAASSESSSVRAADSRVFNILWEQCGGNPLAAIELWLNAVKVKGRIAEVGVPQRPSANLLNGLKDDLYFIYTAIVSHSALSTSEIMQVTHFSEPVVRHALKQGINLGMIMRDESKRYMVDPYWYGTLSGFLHRKNMLWG